MQGSEEDNGKKDGGKTSGVTRRIVVKDLPPEETPQVKGRKLSTPAELDKPPQRTTTHSPSVSTPTQRISARTQANLRQTTPAAPIPVVQKQPSTLNVKRLLILVGAIVFVPSLLVAIILVLPKPKKKAVSKDTETAASIS